MKLSYLPFFGLLGILYAVGLYLIQGSLQKPVLLTIISVCGLLMLASFFMRAPKDNTDPAAPAQRFILGTTIQILLSMAYLVYARFKLSGYFESVALHFMILFAAGLIAQSVLLIKTLRK